MACGGQLRCHEACSASLHRQSVTATGHTRLAAPGRRPGTGPRGRARCRRRPNRDLIASGPAVTGAVTAIGLYIGTSTPPATPPPTAVTALDRRAEDRMAEPRSCCCPCRFHEPAAFEAGSGADERDQAGAVDGSPDHHRIIRPPGRRWIRHRPVTLHETGRWSWWWQADGHCLLWTGSSMKAPARMHVETGAFTAGRRGVGHRLSERERQLPPTGEAIMALRRGHVLADHAWRPGDPDARPRRLGGSHRPADDVGRLDPYDRPAVRAGGRPDTSTRRRPRRGARGPTEIDRVMWGCWSSSAVVGAAQLAAVQRVDLAEDPLELPAFDGPTNEAEGDGDASQWLPPATSYGPADRGRGQVPAVDHPREKTGTARQNVLATCPSQGCPPSSDTAQERTEVEARSAAGQACVSRGSADAVTVVLVNGAGNRVGHRERCPEWLIGDPGLHRPSRAFGPAQVRILPSPPPGRISRSPPRASASGAESASRVPGSLPRWRSDIHLGGFFTRAVVPTAAEPVHRAAIQGVAHPVDPLLGRRPLALGQVEQEHLAFVRAAADTDARHHAWLTRGCGLR